MKIKIEKITNVDDSRWAIEKTMPRGFKSKASLKNIFSYEHSVSRLQEYKIELEDIPYFVQGHLTRHKIGVEFFCRSRRDDRGGEGNDNITRNTLVDFAMKINADALINIAKVRLCFQASPETREVVKLIKNELQKVDPDLAYFMQPRCVYRGGICSEPKSCGNYIVRKYRGEESEVVMRTKPSYFY